MEHERGGLLGMSGIAALVSSLCCLTPVVLVFFGLSTVSAAAALGDTLYFGPARWLFYLVSLAFLGVALTLYFRRRGICTLDQAKRQRNLIVNTTLLVISVAFVGYFLFTYVILELVGQAVGLPWEAWWE